MKYYFKGRSGSVYLTASGVVFDFIREREEVPEEGKEEKPSPGPAGDEPEKVYDRLSFRMLFDGANPDVEIAGEEELPGQMNYFIGSDPERWQTGIPTFAAVSCRDIYPGMEIVFRLEGGTLRWKAIVSPGADPSAIAFLYEGVEGLCLGKGGELLISTAFGVFVEPAPEIYQEEAGQKVFLEGGWKLRDDNLAAIATEGFEPSLPIIIER